MNPSAPTPGSTELFGGKVVLCLGSGGVGKTTIAAGLAMALAARGERVVVLTIDPARRLADALGLRDDADGPRRGSGNQLQEVDLADALPGWSGGRGLGESRGSGFAGRLWATMLDPADTFESVVRDEAESAQQAERILGNALFGNLARSLSGTNEYMAAERLHQLYHDERFDRVVVDTPPSRHALDFLDSPGRLNRFINHRLYRSVFAPRSQLLRTVNAGGRIVLRLLGRLVGTSLVDDVIEFFAAFEGLDDGFDRRSRELTRVLTTDAVFALVTTARREPLDEAAWIAQNLVGRLGRENAVDALIVNRLCPVAPDPVAPDPVAPDPVAPDPVAPDWEPSGSDDPLAVNLAQLAALAGQEHSLIDGFIDGLGTAPAVIPVHEIGEPVSDRTGLIEVSRQLLAAVAALEESRR